MSIILEWLQSKEGIETLIIIVAIIFILLIANSLKKRLFKKETAATMVIFGFIKYLLFAIAALLILDINGINISHAVAGLGIVSIIIGFALQDALKDAIMGLHILGGKFFKIGDVIKYGDFEGQVTHFTVSTTKIKSIYDNSILSICNRNLEMVTAVSGLCDIDIPMPYEEDPEEMYALMHTIAEEISKVKHVVMSNFIGTQEFNDSSISYRVRFHCNPVYKPQARRDSLMVIQKCLKESGKSIPFTQIVVHEA